LCFVPQKGKKWMEVLQKNTIRPKGFYLETKAPKFACHSLNNEQQIQLGAWRAAREID